MNKSISNTFIKNSIKKAVKDANTSALKFLSRRIAATLLLLAILLPVALPVPALAYKEPTAEEKFAATLFEKPESESFVNSFAGAAKSFAASPLAYLNNFYSGEATDKTKEIGKEKTELEKAAERAALLKKVKRIEINLKVEKTLLAGESFPLSALPLDEKGDPVHGVAPQWRSSDNTVLSVEGGSEAVAESAGEAVLTVRAGDVKETISVKVAESDKKAAAAADKDKIAHNDSISKGIIKEAAKPANLNAAPARRLMLNQLPPNERDSVYSPQNNLGTPPGQVEIDSPNRAAALPVKHRTGIANFSFGVPFASLPGRGVDAAVGMTYNSRTWNKSCEDVNCSTNRFTYDVDESWIAPGFTSGFGYVDSYSVPGSPYPTIVPSGLTDPDGTRHQLECKSYTGSSCNYYETSDGTFIKVSRNVAPYTRTSGFTARYPDGTKINYAYPIDPDYAGKYFPYSIQDSNGNRIIISYKDASGKIDYIRDTLNRYIRFVYETTGAQRLIAVKVPGYNGGTDRQTIRFYYGENVPLNYAGKFSGTVTAPATIRTLQYVYFPST